MLEILGAWFVFLLLGFLVVVGIVFLAAVAASLFWCLLTPVSKQRLVSEWDSWIERTEEKTPD